MATDKPITEPEELRQRAVRLDRDPFSVMNQLQACAGLTDAAAEIKRLRHEIAVRDLALRKACDDMLYGPIADASYIADARKQLEREAKEADPDADH